MKKIAFLLGSKNVGGIEKVVSNLGRDLSSCGYDIHNIMLISNYSKEIEFDGKIIPILPQGDSLLSKFLIFFKRLYRVRKVRKEYNFDIVVSFGDTANCINILTKHNEKIITSLHAISKVGNSYIGGVGKIYALLTCFLYPYTDCMIVVSKELKKIIIKQYDIPDEKVRVIYNGINCDEIMRKGRFVVVPNIKKDDINLINVGRLVNEKGQWHLIRIMPELVKKYPNIHLFIIGDGYLRDELNKLIKTLHMEDYIMMLGYQDNPYKYMSHCNIYVQASISEAFSLAIVEAMTLGIPVISADTLVGPREIIADNIKYEKNIQGYSCEKYGILTSRYSQDVYINDSPLIKEEVDMINAIEEMIKNKELYDRYSKSGHERSKLFSAEKMKETYDEILRG